MAIATSTTRRAVLKSVPAAAAASLLPVAAKAEMPDTELLRKEAEFNTAYARFDDAAHRLSKIEDRANAAKPPRPERGPIPKDLDKAVDAVTIEQIRAGSDARLAALNAHFRKDRERLEAWQAECNAIERRYGVHAAEDEENRLMNEAGDIANAVLDMPAHTAAGVLAKLRVHDLWTFDSNDILASIRPDIEAMNI